MAIGLVRDFWEGARLTICSAQTSLSFPPDDADCGIIANLGAGKVSQWNSDEFFIRITAAGSTNLTACKLWAMVREPFSFSDDVWTSAHATETFTAASHVFTSGMGPALVTSDDTLPAGLSTWSASTDATKYWIKKTSANDFQLCTSLENCFTSNVVAVSDDGTGNHTISDFPDDTHNRTHKIHFASVADLGDDVAGTLTVTLTADKAYIDGPFVHAPGVIGYAVSATFSASEAVTISAYPRKVKQ